MLGLLVAEEADEMMDSKAFVSWEEVVISNEKGRREVHYFLRRSDGGSDLAVVGKEKSPRHMWYVVQNHFLRSLSPSSSLKWRSRREVVDWLDSVVTGTGFACHLSLFWAFLDVWMLFFLF